MIERIRDRMHGVMMCPGPSPTHPLLYGLRSGAVAFFAPIFSAALLISPLKPALISTSIYNFSLLLLEALCLLGGMITYYFDMLTRYAISGRDLDVELTDGTSAMLSTLVGPAMQKLALLHGKNMPSASAASRFLVPDPRSLITGDAMDAALGINFFMQVNEQTVYAQMGEGGVAAIVAEVQERGTEVDRECLQYVLYQEAGSSSATFQAGLTRDQGRDGEKLDDFVAHPFSQTAHLTRAHVLALRIRASTARCEIAQISGRRIRSQSPSTTSPMASQSSEQ